MPRTLAFCLCLLAASCQSVEKASVQPLPPGGPPLNYTDLVQRGKNQIAYAHESFYRDQWEEVRRAAGAMRETSGQLASLDAAQVPAVKRAQFAQWTQDLKTAADQLDASGQAKDVEKTSAAFTKLHLVIRQMLVE